MAALQAPGVRRPGRLDCRWRSRPVGCVRRGAAATNGRPAADACLRPFRIGLVEGGAQPLADRRQLVDDRLGPVEVGAPPLERPAARRIGGDVAQVRGLVGELDQRGAACSCAAHARSAGACARACRAGCRRSPRARCRRPWRRTSRRISSKVVSVSSTVSCSTAAIRVLVSTMPPFDRQRPCQGDRMVDVRAGLDVLAPLLAMLVRGEGQGLEELRFDRRPFHRPTFLPGADPIVPFVCGRFGQSCGAAGRRRPTERRNNGAPTLPLLQKTAPGGIE